MLELIPIDKLSPAADNPRRHLGDLTELAASITEVGILQHPVVTPGGDGSYLIVCGHRRVGAAKLAGLTDVECDVRVYDSDEARAEAMLAENIARASLSPVDEAIAFQRMIDLGYSQHKIAGRVGCQQGHVSKRISLLRLPPRAQGLLEEEKIGIGDALELVKVVDIEDAVDRVLDMVGKPRWQDDVAGATASVLADHERAEKVKAVTAKLKDKGVRIAPWPAQGWWHASGGRRLDSYEWTIDAKKHAALPCHAASVDPHRADVVLICTKPASHPEAKRRTSGSGPLSEQEKQRRRELKVRQQLADAQEARAEVMRALLGRRGTAKGLLELLAGQLLDGDVNHAYRSIACELLGLKPIEAKFQMHPDAATPLREFAAKSPDNINKVALALAFAVGEGSIRGPDHPHFEQPTAVRHFAFLETAGWKPSPVEKPARPARRTRRP